MRQVTDWTSWSSYTEPLRIDGERSWRASWFQDTDFVRAPEMPEGMPRMTVVPVYRVLATLLPDPLPHAPAGLTALHRVVITWRTALATAGFVTSL